MQPHPLLRLVSARAGARALSRYFGTLPRYTPALWLEYTQFCRDLARRTGPSIREIDRALWQYSKASGHYRPSLKCPEN